MTNSKIRNERRVEEHVTLLLTSTNLTGDDPFWDLSSEYIRRKCLKVWSLHSKVAHLITIAVYLVNSRTWRSSYFSSALGWTNKYKLEKNTSSKTLRSSNKPCNHIYISLNCILNVFFFLCCTELREGEQAKFNYSLMAETAAYKPEWLKRCWKLQKAKQRL